ncbi:uncharacterized protein LOC107361272 isoform X2 [Tetranychus urticae]|uniref:uncharacterized protein LOC107361272 isoform X2 n=1 Tax=Tetranychus urticae TaxID=32264 RepID=UPI00077B882B|nr:uncharacterized protein LOC107361272 isoform X2 [Tetranychus urticae]
MEDFLIKCRFNLKRLLENKQFKHVHLVIGNESCDLDSCVSSLVYSYLLYISKYSSSKDQVTLPVLNINRDRLFLKSEVAFWLEETLQIKFESVLCKDEVNLLRIRENVEQISFTIVDHNEDREMENFGEIVEIIDHHKVLNPSHQIGTQCEIDLDVGSCCTLIARRYLDYCETQKVNPDVQIALMLYGTIILDTVCFSESAHRFSQLDINIAKRLKNVIGSEMLTDQEIYSQLITAIGKASSMLGLTDLLTKDLKIIDGIGGKKVALSSLCNIHLKETLSKPDISAQLGQYCRANNCLGSILLAIRNENPNNVERDLAIYFSLEDLLRKVCNQLESSACALDLELLFEKENLKVYKQNNVKASRKAILPMIAQIMSNERAALESQRAHYGSNKKASEDNDPLRSKVSTADVDPDFVLNYKPETIDFPESPRDYINESATAIENPVEIFTNNTRSKGKNHSNPSSRTVNSSEMADQSDPGSVKDGNNIKSSIQTSTQSQSGSMYNSTQQQQSQPQLDSMNVYGSYIDDSYVGDFSGEVTNPDVMIEETPQDPIYWENQSKLVDGVLEFSFDSFGPESMLFPRNGENREGEDNSKSLLGSSVKDSDNDLMSITTASERTDVSFDQFTVNSSDHNESETGGTSLIKNQISPPSTTPQPVEFLKRNTSLTQSQRRKIRPKIDIQEIFNSSDETNAHDDDQTVNDLIENETSKEDGDDFNDTKESNDVGSKFDENSTSSQSNYITKEDTFFNDNNYLESPVSTKEELEDTLQKQGSLAKKKILVNKELLSNDDMIIDFPHTQQEENRVPELSAQEEMNETRSWRESCPIGDKGEVKKIDLKVIEPYKKVLSHGGYYHHYNSAQLNKNNTTPGPGPAIIIFSACYLPDRSRKDYGYVMDNLFMYVLTTLHELVADDYILIYFHNAGCAGVSSNNMPTFSWLKRCYTMIDKRLRKNLKSLFLVHPTFWLKTFVIMTKPFISSKFSKKLKFVSTLAELNDLVPIESTVIPPPVKQYDEVASNLDK